MTTPYSCAARAMVRATGDSFIADRSRLAGRRSRWPIASCVPVFQPSVRLAGHEIVPFFVNGMPRLITWSMWPARSSDCRMVAPHSARPLAEAP